MTHNSNEKDFWSKLSNNASNAGKDVVRKALTLYYASQSDKVPAWAKTIIFSSLAYFILPLDAIPDTIPVIGYTDDLGVLLSALAALEMHITSEHEASAEAKLQKWFPDKEGGSK